MHQPILRCFIYLKGLSCRDLLVGLVPELASWLTVETKHRSSELGSEWSLGHDSGVRASRGKCLSIGLDMG
jgi:hypothetical protein